ncbi:MAG: Gldg family protein [Clostridia bacterium]|nr:Gldg family protein [Clostridia bacterium]
MSNSALFRMKRSVKIGTYSFVMGVIVLAALIVANLLVGSLPAKVTRFSLDDQSITDISDETVKFVSGLSEDVTIYWLCEEEVVDEETSLFLTRYEEAGKHVKVEIVDPLKNPTFTNKYSDTTISQYSFIVESARRYIVVDYASMYYFTNSFLASELGLTEPLSQAMLTSYVDQYATIVQMYYGVDLSSYNAVHSFCGEAKLTSAIDYVTREYIPHAYVLTGHGNAVYSEALNELVVSMGVEAQRLDLSKAAKVPVDANCLILYAPTTDLSAHEAALLTDYLNAGGSLILNTAPETVNAMPNLQSVTALFGLTAAEGIVEEGQEAGTSTPGCVSGKPQTLVPTVNTQYGAVGYVQSNLQSGSNLPQMTSCHAILSAGKLPTGVTVTSLFTTSDKATCVDGQGAVLSQAGKKDIAVTATKNVASENGTTIQGKLTWYGSTTSFGGSSLSANDYYYAATAAVLGEPFSSAYANLSAVVFETETLDKLTASSVWIIGAVTVIVLPLTLLIIGVVIWVLRKRR